MIIAEGNAYSRSGETYAYRGGGKRTRTEELTATHLQKISQKKLQKILQKSCKKLRFGERFESSVSNQALNNLNNQDNLGLLTFQIPMH